jgi:phenylalanyl-tRNA synthetase beta chain
MASNGFLESRNISLESPQLVSEFSSEIDDAVKLVNSKEEMSLLRKSLLPGLLETISRNARRDAENFRYFELDRTFRKTSDKVVEKWVVAAVAGGLTYDIDWSANKTKIDFFQVKGIAQSLLETFGITPVTFHPEAHPGFTEGQTAEIKLGSEILGIIGAIDQELLTAYKIKESIYGFEMNLESMLKASAGVQAFKEVPRMPAVVRDIAMVFDNLVPYSEIEKRICDMGGNILEDVRCIDVYEGKHIQHGSRSVSVRLRFRDPQRTLSTDEVSLIIEYIIDTLKQEYSATLRE